jgi:hypothetical protein
MLRTLLPVAAALILSAPARAQLPSVLAGDSPLSEPGANVTISLLTMGNGELVWEMFGHSAIMIRSDRTGRDTVFNWGVFDFRQPNFILHFLENLNSYQMGGETLDTLLAHYRYWNRSVTAQELNLTTAQKDTLLAVIRENARPENLSYRYDYFIDNCATRPRDILDRVLGGQLRVGADSFPGTSYRWHTLRLMQGNIPLVLGVDIGLGEPSDRPTTKWQEMFLPRELHDWVATRQVRDSSGALRPLVRGERVLFQSSREPEATAPPPLGRWLWPAGILLGALFAWLGLRATPARRRARLSAATVFAVWAGIVGILGVLLTALWTVTDHRFAYANENLLLFNPLWLVLAVTLPMTFSSGRAARISMVTTTIVTSLAVIALFAHLGISRQANLPIIGLGLPPALGIWTAVRARIMQRSAAL